MSDILVHEQGGVCTLTLNRPDKKNSLTSSMYAELANLFTQAQENPSVRVLVIQGSETVFCAGNDISDFIENPPSTLQSPVFIHHSFYWISCQ